MGSKLSFLRFPSLSQPSFPPEDSLQTVSESESSRQDEEVVNDSPSISDDQTMRTPCVRKPTPPTTTRQPPHPPHCSSYRDRGSDIVDSYFGSPTTASRFIEPACETMDVVLPQPWKPTSAKRRLLPEFEKSTAVKVREKKAKVVEEEEEAAKKKKKKSGNRLWSEEDEVLILKGLTDFQKKKGAEPCRDMGEFHELIKESLSVDASKNQLLDKIRKLKRKYVAKGGKGLLSKPHEHECFELSNRIWIDGGGGGGGALSTRGATRKNATQLDDSMALDEEKGKEVLALGEKAEELEKKWGIWRADEVALRLRQDELIEEQKELLLDVVVRASKE